MRRSIQRVSLALVVLALTSATVAMLASGAPAAKSPKPGHVVASADILWHRNCGLPSVDPTPGHIEVNAFDLDPSSPGYDRQADRISVTLTIGDQTIATDPVWLTIAPGGGSAFIMLDPSLQMGLSLNDGGNPGVAKDSLSFSGIGTCGKSTLSLTDGNVNIKPGG